MPAVYLALLRGVNVGGKNRLPMKELAELFVSIGCTDVRTFIQSGNVVFTASGELYAQLPELLPLRIRRRFGFQVPVVLRTLAQLEAVAGGNPLFPRG